MIDGTSKAYNTPVQTGVTPKLFGDFILFFIFFLHVYYSVKNPHSARVLPILLLLRGALDALNLSTDDLRSNRVRRVCVLVAIGVVDKCVILHFP